MAQKKKIKINNRPRQKEKKVVDIANLNEQLDLLGLKVRSVTADGNCFFRAMKSSRERSKSAVFDEPMGVSATEQSYCRSARRTRGAACHISAISC
jgi:uncharacterized protein (DUF1697 family)